LAPLDGLRGLALLAVLGYHAGPGVVRGGFLGVESFFVLSGFLLTALLLDEHRRRGAIDRLSYFGRRVRRIYPAMVALLVALVTLVPILDYPDAHRLAGDVLSSLFGVTNWHLIADGSSYFTRLGNPSFLRHLWSVAIEIQFYAVCPFLVAWLARQRTVVAARTLLAGIAASSLLMAVLYSWPDPSRAYFGTDTRAGALLSGCLLAVLLSRRGDPMAARYRTTASQIAGPVALVVLAFLALFASETSRLLYPAGFLMTQAATATLIIVSLRPGWLRAFLSRRDLGWLGKRSYGIYLWHWPLVVFTLHWSSRFGAAMFTISAALVLGALSYGLVERPFMKPGGWRRTPLFTRRVRAGVALAGIVAATVVLVRLPTTDPIAQSLKAGQRVLANQLSPIAAASMPHPTVPPTLPTGAPTTAPPTTAPPAPPPPPPPPPFPVVAIGDSVMVGAAPALQARLGPGIFIDAAVGRQFSEGAAIVRRLREQGRLGRVVIVHLGDNGPFSTAEMDSLMAELDQVPTVLFVNVRVSRAWQAEVNQALAAAAPRYPKMRLVDWFAFSAPHGEWMASDGTHTNTHGAAAFADLLAGSIPPPPPPPPPAPTTTTTAPSPPITTMTGARSSR